MNGAADRALDLGQLQAWMQDAVLGSLDEGDASRPWAGTAPRVVTRSARLGEGERLAVYQRGVRARLVDCLRSQHPGLRHALGDDLFDAFACDYLHHNPPSGRTLADLDDRWAEHLARTRPDADQPTGAREAWPDFLVDLARLERAFNVAFEGPGTEGGPVVDPGDLPGPADGNAWPGLTFQAAPCLAVMAARFPVGPYLVAVRRGDRPPLPPAQPSYLALCRRHYDVTITVLDAAQHALLGALVAGVAFGEAATRDAQPARQWARSWAGQGFFVLAVNTTGHTAKQEEARPR